MSNITTLVADGSTPSVRMTGSLYQIEADGDLGGGTVSVRAKSSQGNFIVAGDRTLTESGFINVEMPSGSEIEGNLNGATGPNVTLHIKKIR